MKITVSKKAEGNILFYPYWFVNDDICDVIPWDIKTKLDCDIKFLSDKFKYKRYLSGNNEVGLINLYKKEEIDLETIRQFVSTLYDIAKSEYIDLLNLFLYPAKWGLNTLDVITASFEGLMLSDYNYYGFKAKRDENFKIKKIVLIPDESPDEGELDALLRKNDIVTESIYLTRDLVNGPANVITIDYLENFAISLAKENNLKIKILKESDLIKEKMNLILAVGRGSSQKPRIIELSYNVGKKFPTVCLVGKGIVFDSGGLNLKPGNSLEEMKSDMAGAATVLAIIKAASKLALPVNLLAVLPLAENALDKNSYRPGDVFFAYNKKSVVIKNTDAEGRLILADALSYSDTKNPDVIIDFATLTGSALIALGRKITAAFFRDDTIKKKIFDSSKKKSEMIWELPLYKEYKEYLKDDIADISNIGNLPKEAGTIMAALFLSEFVNNKNWVHFDIAGTAFIDKESYYNTKGATGVMVRTIIDFLENY